MRQNRTLARLRAGETVFGCSQQFYTSSEIPRLFAAAGFDFLFVDGEHGGFDLETIQASIAAAAASGITPLVRVCELLYSQVARVLDLGAQGVIFPRVEDARLLETAISWTKFPPRGVRGYGVFPPHYDYEARSVEAVMAHLNENLMVAVQFETRRALDAAGELLAVPGVDVAMVGPTDLSISLGVPGQFDHPVLVQAVERLIERCRAQGVVPGIHNRSASSARFWAERGMRFIGAGSELSMLIEKAREVMALLEGCRQLSPAAQA